MIKAQGALGGRHLPRGHAATRRRQGTVMTMAACERGMSRVVTMAACRRGRVVRGAYGCWGCSQASHNTRRRLPIAGERHLPAGRRAAAIA